MREALLNLWNFLFKERKLGTVSGIPLILDPSFIVVLLITTIQDLYAGLTLAMVFVSVTLHELGHALMARRYGIGTKQIKLFFFGGIASVEAIPNGKAEAAIGIAGPIVSLVLAVALLHSGVWFNHDFLLKLGGINAMLFLFNMIPAVPLDGGRVFRGLLTLALPFKIATIVSIVIGLPALIVTAVVINTTWVYIVLGIAVILGAMETAYYLKIGGYEEHVPVKYQLYVMHDNGTLQREFETKDEAENERSFLRSIYKIDDYVEQGNDASFDIWYQSAVGPKRVPVMIPKTSGIVDWLRSDNIQDAKIIVLEVPA